MAITTGTGPRRTKPTVRWNERTEWYEGWVSFGRGPDGKRVRRVARSKDKAEAQRRYEELLRQAGEGETPGDRTFTVNDALDYWFVHECPALPRSRGRKKKSATTIDNCRMLADGHLRPALGFRAVETLTADEIEKALKAMAEKGYAKSTVDHAFGTLHQALDFSRRRKKVRTHPCVDVMLPEARDPRRRKSLTPDQLRFLVRDQWPHDFRGPMWTLGVLAGLRPGELISLTWPNVDLELGVVHAGFDYEKPGTNSKRSVVLHPAAVDALTKQREQMESVGLYAPDGLVFPTSAGTMISHSNLRRDFSASMADAGFGEDWTVYELRHTFVSILSDADVSIERLADLVGHSDTRTTLGYRKPVRDALGAAAEAWQGVLD